MPKIFISYRREDSKHAVGRLHATLKRHVRNPKRDIFMDIDNIPRGVDFIDYLDAQVAQCDVMLAVIGPQWASVRDPKTSRRRLDDPNDFVRIEVASALKRGIPVVPVWLDDTPVPAAGDLPDDLKALARRNGERLEHESFDSDVERLIRNLAEAPQTRISDKKVGPKVFSKFQSSGLRKWLVPVMGVPLLAMTAGATFLFWPKQMEETLSAVASPDAIERALSVRSLQEALRRLGQYSGAADGRPGTDMRNATAVFARTHGLSPPDLDGGLPADIEAFAGLVARAADQTTTPIQLVPESQLTPPTQAKPQREETKSDAHRSTIDVGDSVAASDRRVILKSAARGGPSSSTSWRDMEGSWTRVYDGLGLPNGGYCMVSERYRMENGGLMDESNGGKIGEVVDDQTVLFPGGYRYLIVDDRLFRIDRAGIELCEFRRSSVP